MRRKIVRIDESKCNGCGHCVTSCVEGAIRLVDGKARLVSDSYCDGLGACLGDCPVGAITIEEREAPVFDEEAAKRHMASAASSAKPHQHSFACPGAQARQMPRVATSPPPSAETESELTNWPVQLGLVSPNAPWLEDADLLLTADCVPFAFPDFHRRLLKGKPVVIACPKLDDTSPYIEKLAAIFAHRGIKSVTVVHMEVPCCFGLVRMAQAAIAAGGRPIPLRDVTVSVEGKVTNEQ